MTQGETAELSPVSPQGGGAMQPHGCAALWVLLLAQVSEQVSKSRRDQWSP